MVPPEVRTARLRLRRWHRTEAAELLPILEGNVEHLRHWIPETVHAPAPLADLEERLAGFASDFDADRAWRFALFLIETDELLGEASLFPRSPDARVPLPAADRVEIGYWIREDATGRGYATEAAQALVAVAAALPGIRTIEIRCDSRNAASAAVARRLGFILVDHGAAPPSTTMLWQHRLHRG